MATVRFSLAAVVAAASLVVAVPGVGAAAESGSLPDHESYMPKYESDVVHRYANTSEMSKNVSTPPDAARHIASEYNTSSPRFSNISSKSLSSSPDGSYQSNFGPSGGQDAGFQKFMPGPEQSNYHKYSNDQGRKKQATAPASSSVPGQGAQSDDLSGSYQAQYGGGNYVNQYAGKLTEESDANRDQVKHGGIAAVFLAVATAATAVALILPGWASHRVAEEEEEAAGYFLHA